MHGVPLYRKIKGRNYHYRTYHFIYYSQKPGASQCWLSARAQTEGILSASLKFMEPAASVRFKIASHPSAQFSKHRGLTFIRSSMAPGKVHSWSLHHISPSSKLVKTIYTVFYCFAFLQTSFIPGSAPPNQTFFSCSDKSRVNLKGLNMLWTHGRRVTLPTAEGGCFLE